MGCPNEGGDTPGGSKSLSYRKCGGGYCKIKCSFYSGLLDQNEVDMLVDSGSSISLTHESVATAYSKEIKRPPKRLELISADGKEMPVIGCITLLLCLDKLQVVAYASSTLTQAERNYSVIQRECLAIVYVLKQFCHYLLGRQFTLLTDHAPLQWLAGQKMEGLLARWALATQEYDFTISYRKGTANSNADALSRKQNYTNEQCAATLCLPQLLPDLQQHQTNDPIISQLCDELQSGTSPQGRKWHHQPLRRYKQLWSQLLMKDGIICK